MLRRWDGRHRESSRIDRRWLEREHGSLTDECQQLDNAYEDAKAGRFWQEIKKPAWSTQKPSRADCLNIAATGVVGRKVSRNERHVRKRYDRPRRNALL